jgi:branched-chain amino acid transport system substrate-binding protein
MRARGKKQISDANRAGWTRRARPLSRRNGKLWAIVTVTGTASLFITACGSSGSGSNSGSGGSKTIVVGAPVDLSGPAAGFGKTYAKALQYAVDQVNANGGIKALGGAKLDLKVQDDKSDPQVAVQILRQMKQEGAAVFLGPITSSSVVASKPTILQLGIPLITSAGDPTLAKDNKGLIFLSALDSYGITDRTMDFLHAQQAAGKIHVRKLGVLSTTVPSGPQVHDQTIKRADAEGWTTTDVAYDASQTKDFAPLVAKFRQANVDLVTGYSFPADGIAFAQAVAAQSWRPKDGFVWTIGSASAPGYQAALGSIVTNWMSLGYATINTSCPATKTTADAFKEKYGVLPTSTDFAAMAGVNIFVAAAEKAKSVDASKLQAALQSGDELTKFCEGTYFMPGVVKYDERGENIGWTGAVRQFDGKGAEVGVWPEGFATGDPVWPAK